MRPTVLLGLIVATASPLQALEIHFRPSFVELVSDGVSQRVRPGELVEVPVGESTLEMEVSEQSPRTVELRARGRCEFEVFGSPSVLEDAGKMTISMDPGTKKLDIGWVKGEMKSAPSSFDKSSTAAFFASSPDDFMRPLDFPGVRPFGYTDVLEGRGSMVAEGDWRNLPPLPVVPARPRVDPRRPPPDYYEDPDMVADWRTFEEDHSDLPPLSLPPPTRERRPPSPTQVLMLSPSTPTKSEPVPPEPTPETKPGEGRDDIDSEEETLAEDGTPSEDAAPRAAGEDVAEGSPSPAPGTTPETTQETTPETSPPTASEPSPEPSPIVQGSPAPPQPAAETTSPPTALKNGIPPQGGGGTRIGVQKPQRPLPPSTVSKSARPGQAGPTLYDRIVAQEEKQKEVIELLREVSKQMQEIKSAPTPPPTPPQEPANDGGRMPPEAPSPAPRREPIEAAKVPPSVPVVPAPTPTPEKIPSLPRSSSSPQAVQPIGSTAGPAPSRPVDLGASGKPSATPGASLQSPVAPRQPVPGTSASVQSQSEDWDFTLEAVGTQK